MWFLAEGGKSGTLRIHVFGGEKTNLENLEALTVYTQKTNVENLEVYIGQYNNITVPTKAKIRV